MPWHRSSALLPSPPATLKSTRCSAPRCSALGRVPEGMAALERAFALGYDDANLRAAYEELRTQT